MDFIGSFISQGVLAFRHTLCGALGRICRSLALLCAVGLFVTLHACSEQELPKGRGSLSSVTAGNLTSSLIDKRDEQGNPIELKGFISNSKIENQDASSLANDSEHAFEFEPPAGVEAEFSEPIPVTGSYLDASQKFEEQCSQLPYTPTEPTIKDILSHMQKQNLCGDLQVNFCIRMKIAGRGVHEKYSYLKSPLLALKLICPDQSFADAQVQINNGAAFTKSSETELNLSFSPYVTDMYITNEEGCKTGGNWQAASSTIEKWTLANVNASASVYASFKDLLGNESRCLSASIMHDSIAPSEPSLTIEPYHATQLQLELALQANGASEMYLTDTADCKAGGDWEPYTATKTWTRHQDNSPARVYVKYRDEAGNETDCIANNFAQATLQELVTDIDGDGNPRSINGYVENAQLKIDDVFDSRVLLAGNVREEAFFTFEAIDGYEISYSEPALLSANELREQSPTAASYCSDKQYEVGAPTLDDLLRNAKAAGKCGELTVHFCIKASSQVDASAASGYLQNPTATLRVMCPAESFANASLLVNADAPTTTSDLVAINLAAGSAVTDMYLTNVQNCESGGEWVTLTSPYPNWSLAAQDSRVSVYGKLRDFLGNESGCLSDTIVHDGVAPTGLGFSIVGGDIPNSSNTVTLLLAADDASDMYVTNVAGCSSGGVWEAFGSPKSNWTLGQSNATATVYVKYRDLAGNVSSCLSDTAIHDSVAPLNPTLGIAANADTTNATVALTLGADGASEMYITNTAGCGSGGAWEAYATTKASWTLAAARTTTMVYVKYRDLAANVSACVSMAYNPCTAGQVVLSHVGSDQSFTVPTSCGALVVRMVGAGGGSGGTGYDGGGGGYVSAIMSVAPGDLYTVIVGGAGQATQWGNTAVGGYGGGALGRGWGAGGGGRSAIRRDGVNDDLVTAGGGGGAASNCASGMSRYGGPGGGLVGGAGGGVGGGAGGSQVAGGAAYGNGAAGSAYLGGTPPDPIWGGGGGGGYFGGGSGTNYSCDISGGGGGSSYYGGTGVSRGFTAAGAGRLSGNNLDSLFAANGLGGVGAGGGGTHGLVVIAYGYAASSVTPSSGPAAGSTAITITGIGFAPTSLVSIGGTPCANVEVVSVNEISCVTPAGSLGAVDVTVSDSLLGTTYTLSKAFTFAP